MENVVILWKCSLLTTTDIILTPADVASEILVETLTFPFQFIFETTHAIHPPTHIISRVHFVFPKEQILSIEWEFYFN